jgi:YYY domain-containing protein
MLTFLIWYILIAAIGVVSFPIIYRLMPALADRGYALSRILGLLIWGYVFWLFASLGILRNDLGGLLLGLIVLIGVSYWALRGIPFEELRVWWRDHRRLVFSIEALFLVAFASWTIVRSANPEILGTEKPMELAFINAILRSPEFPPHDPWLSGYAISYYYFGYVMTAMIAKLTATTGSVAFNMAISQTFALSAIAAFGILYTLLGAIKTKRSSNHQSGNSQNLLLSLLGPVFVLIVSNLEGFLEVLHARGLFWQQGENGQLSSTFWQWLDMKELSLPPAQPFSWIPSRYLWWWRASRVVQDYDLAGNWREVIDEFPFFSYLLGDLHPHVLVMPFALLAVGMCLNVFLGGGGERMRWLGINLTINSRIFWSSALIIGGLAFLNTWDFPMYVFLFSLVYVFCKVITARQLNGTRLAQTDQDLADQPEVRHDPSLFAMAKDFLLMAIALALSGVLLYLPFYIGFSSQAGGILPNLIYSTRGTHLWVMFGALLLPIFAYLIFFRKRKRNLFFTGWGFLLALGLVIGLWLFSLLFGIGIASIPLIGNLYLSSLGGEPGTALFVESLARRKSGLGWVTLILLLGLTFGYLLALLRPKSNTVDIPDSSLEPEEVEDFEQTKPSSPTSNGFAFLLILTGGLLVLFTEFFYLRDLFGSRMNTIFKFYFQTWIFWGLAAAFASAVLLKELRRFWAVAFRIGLAFLLLAALAYPLLSLWNKTNGFNPSSGFTLDGTSYLESGSQEDDVAGIRWLESAQGGVAIEAVGPQYSEYARVATISGQPNVLGWAGHESQWRGGRQEIGTREEDIATIYRTNNWEDTKLLLDMYNVRYVFIGTLERRTYNVNESKFERFLGEPVFKSGQVSIYEIPR